MKRKKHIAEQHDLLAPKPAAASSAPGCPTPVAPEPVAVPKILEFQPLTSAEQWRVEKFDELAAEFQFAGPDWAKQMAWFLELVQRHSRAWLVVRRVFGVAPLIPSPDAHPDDLHVWTRDALEAQGFQVQGELDALRALWKASLEQEQRTGAGDKPPEPPKTELELDDKILERHGFSERMFDMMVWSPTAGENGKGAEVPRSAEERRRERDWFCAQVKGWERQLNDAQAGPIARAALRNVLQLERIANEMGTVSPTSTKYDRLNEQHRKTEDAYRKQLEELQVMFPEMSVAGKVAARGTVSDLNLAHRMYYGHKDRRLMDGMFTGQEIEFLLRTSVQLPTSRYRFGLTLAVIEARHFLYDPEYRPMLKPSVLKKATAGFTAGADAVRDDDTVVDLEKGVLPGEGDDFPDFNDVPCPACKQWFSSSLKQCPNCKKP